METKMSNMTYLALLLLVLGILSGCAGMEAFPLTARAGDTVAFGVGWKQKFDRETLTVTITDAASNTFTYLPNDPAVRAVINLYPDPLSYLVVGTRTGSNDRYGATYGSVINGSFTENDPDWWQTTIYLDLPAGLAEGQADVTFVSSNGETYGPRPVQIIPGQGSRYLFKAELLGAMTPVQMQSMERRSSSTVQLSGGSTFPAAIQIDLTHSPDDSAGGTGKAFAVNPRGEVKNLTWTDNGTSMRVMLLTAKGNTTLNDWKQFKFYVTGGVTGVQVQSVKAYDSAGNLISGVTATVN